MKTRRGENTARSRAESLRALVLKAFTGRVLALVADQEPGEIKHSVWRRVRQPAQAAVVGGAAYRGHRAILGDWVGKHHGKSMLQHLPNRFIDDKKIARAQQIVRRDAGRAVLLGRFATALHALSAGTVGMSQILYGTFLIWNRIGRTVWAAAHVMIGYLAGTQYQRIERSANYIGLVLVVFIAVAHTCRVTTTRNQTPTVPRHEASET